MNDVENSHAAMDEVVDHQTVYSLENMEHTQICHTIPALISSEFLHEVTPTTCEDVILDQGLLLTGINHSCRRSPPLGVLKAASLWT